MAEWVNTQVEPNTRYYPWIVHRIEIRAKPYHLQRLSNELHKRVDRVVIEWFRISQAPQTRNNYLVEFVMKKDDQSPEQGGEHIVKAFTALEKEIKEAVRQADLLAITQPEEEEEDDELPF